MNTTTRYNVAINNRMRVNANAMEISKKALQRRLVRIEGNGNRSANEEERRWLDNVR